MSGRCRTSRPTSHRLGFDDPKIRFKQQMHRPASGRRKYNGTKIHAGKETLLYHIECPSHGSFPMIIRDGKLSIFFVITRIANRSRLRPDR
jgi:hypothetical protein